MKMRRIAVCLFAIVVSILILSSLVAAVVVNKYATTSGGVANHVNVRGVPDKLYATSAFPPRVESVWGGGFGTEAGTITRVEIAIAYRVSARAVDDVLILKYSLDGGVTWGATIRRWVPANTTDVQVFLDVTADRTWTWTNISNLQVWVDFEKVTGRDGVTARVDACFVRITYTDTTLPTYSGAGHNTTIAGAPVLFHIKYNDNIALHPSGQWIFSTNNTGTWVNDSAVNFTSTPQWANVTKTLNSTVGMVVGYRWYAFDNAGNRNNTPIYTLTTTKAAYVAITVSPADVPFGIVNLGSTNQTTGNLINATNTGTATGKMYIKAFNTSGWTLTYANDTRALTGERFFLNHNETGWWEPINLTHSLLNASVPAGGSTLFDLRIGVSSDTAATTEQLTNVTIRIVAV